MRTNTVLSPVLSELSGTGLDNKQCDCLTERKDRKAHVAEYDPPHTHTAHTYTAHTYILRAHILYTHILYTHQAHIYCNHTVHTYTAHTHIHTAHTLILHSHNTMKTCWAWGGEE